MKRFFSLYLFIVLICISCKKHEDVDEPVPLVFNKVVILGNSILYAPENPAEGWPGSWGMAASAANKDYVHLLTQQFKAKSPLCEVNILNIAQFERGYATYDLDANLKSLRDSKPDLLIIRIGENMATDVDLTLFDSKYLALINYFKAANPNIRVFAAGSFWQGKNAVDVVMKKYSPFVSLSILGTDMGNYAWGLFSNQGIASHPNDKGMQGIATMVWDGVSKLK